MHTHTLADDFADFRHATDAAASQRVLESLVPRIKAEYLQMPGLQLTSWHVSRLLGIESEISECLLGVLVASGFLRRTASGHYGRPRLH
jgi:hypothetical protein